MKEYNCLSTENAGAHQHRFPHTKWQQRQQQPEAGAAALAAIVMIITTTKRKIVIDMEKGALNTWFYMCERKKTHTEWEIDIERKKTEKEK